MPFKVSFFYKQQSSRLAGWSENFWNSLVDWSAVKAQADVLRPLLDKLHGAQAYCAHIRFTQLDGATGIPLFRYVENQVLVGSGPRDTATYGDADYPTTALLFELFNAQTKRTKQWIRGIDDDQISNSGNFKVAKDFQKSFDAMKAQLIVAANGWSLRMLKAANANKDVTKLEVATGEVTVPAHGFGANGATIRVRIKGFQSPTAVNKIWRAVVKDVDTITLSFAGELVGQTVKAIQPKARLQTYELLGCSNAQILRSSSHYTGRPIDLFGGRRKTRRR